MNALARRRIFLVLLTLAVVIGCWIVPIDRPAKTQVESGLQRALTAFAAARALGAVLSAAQGTRLEVQPAGMGVSLAPGQALAPLSELVDRFAAVMLAASVAFGIQLLLLNIGAHEAVSALATLAVLCWAALRWGTRSANGARWLQPVLVALLLVRFAVPLSALANEALYRGFMAEDYRQAMAVMESSPAAVDARTPDAVDKPARLLERAKDWWTSLPNPKAAYDAILSASADWAGKMVRLIALFILQTAVLPLAFMWTAWRVARWAVRGSTAATAPTVPGAAAQP